MDVCSSSHAYLRWTHISPAQLPINQSCVRHNTSLIQIGFTSGERCALRPLHTKWNSFTIKGSLRNPRVSVHGNVVRSVSEYALAPLNVLGALVGLVTDGGTDAKNPCLKGKGAAARPSPQKSFTTYASQPLAKISAQIHLRRPLIPAALT